MKICQNSECKKPYANKTDYCSRVCQIKAVAQRVEMARGYIHQPKHAMVDRQFLWDYLEIRL